MMVMTNQYQKLIEQTKPGYIKRAKELINAFADDISFPTEEQIGAYRSPRNNRLDAVLDYLCNEYVNRNQVKHETKGR
jgi:hypothetical protein